MKPYCAIIKVPRCHVGHALLFGFLPLVLSFSAPLARAESDATVPPQNNNTDSTTKSHTGKFVFTHLGREVQVLTAAPKQGGKGLLILFHGATRNALDYRKSGIVLADSLGLDLAVPEFDRSRFDPEAYQEGGVFLKGKLLPPEQRTFTYIAALLRELESRSGNSDQPCWLVGHSAGAQFLCRMAGLGALPVGVRRAVIVNGGALLFPDRTMPWPYGFGGLPATMSDDKALQKYLATPLTFYVGTADTGSSRLPIDKIATRQGATRIERSRNCFAMGKKLAEANRWPFHWALVEAEGLDHRSLPMWEHQHMREAILGPTNAATELRN